MPEYAYVYILSNSFRKLYIGITTQPRATHQAAQAESPPAKPHREVQHRRASLFERFTSIPAAIKREKILKGWLRIRKLDLIIKTNPLWTDLSSDWGPAHHPNGSTHQPFAEIASRANPQHLASHTHRLKEHPTCRKPSA